MSVEAQGFDPDDRRDRWAAVIAARSYPAAAGATKKKERTPRR